MAIEQSCLRVLHSVETFLNVSENWIYPVVACVPGVDTRVACDRLANSDAFPFPRSRLIVSPPSWETALGAPRLFHACARRLGWRNAVAALQIRSWQPHVLHAHFGGKGWHALQLKTFVRVPLVTSFYGSDAWAGPQQLPAWRDRYRTLFAQGSAFFVEGPAMRTRLINLGCPAGKVIIQHIGVDLQILAFRQPCFASGLKVVLAGRFVEKKGLSDGLRACALARAKGADIRVTIIGGPLDTAGERIQAELRELAAGPELAGRVEFTGLIRREQLYARLRDHNVFLCASRHAADGDAEGGLPVVLIEAMALGLLCVGTRHCDIPELIDDKRTGYLADEGDCLAVAEILSSIPANPGLASAVALAGRRRVEEDFSLERQLAKMYGHYADVRARVTRRASLSQLVSGQHRI
jgi:colanic acid/amylovoran biosynthesis glycosyltransferase